MGGQILQWNQCLSSHFGPMVLANFQHTRGCWTRFNSHFMLFAGRLLGSFLCMCMELQEDHLFGREKPQTMLE